MRAQLLEAWSAHAADIGLSLNSRLIEYEEDNWLLRDLAAYPLSPYIAVIQPETLLLAQRATAIAYAVAFETNFDLIGELILADSSAAWVWTGGIPPSTFTTCSTNRYIFNNSGTHRKLNVSRQEIEIIGGIPVLNPDRTFIELKRTTKPDFNHKTFARRLIETAWINEKKFNPKRITRIEQAIFSWKQI